MYINSRQNEFKKKKKKKDQNIFGNIKSFIYLNDS